MKHLTPERRQKAQALIVKAVLKQTDPDSHAGDFQFTKDELELLWAYLAELES